ncbi:MAG: DGQHR domain-containing protein [Oscillospiraceae bacterium]
MKKSKSRRPLTPDQQLARAKTAFKRKIRNIFSGVGFKYVSTNDHEMIVGARTIEIDSLFIYENIWLICEDTVKTANIRDHIRTKNEAFGEVKRNMSSFIRELIKLFPDQKDVFTRFELDRIKVFGLYISREEVILSENDKLLFNQLTFVQPQTLNYFQWIVQAIKHSARNEIFRFLGLRNEQIGMVKSSSEDTKITAPIICPKEITGLKNNVRIVSFMMSAEDMLNNCYVLRKDNWEESIWLYQRLVEKGKIKKIREFLINKGEAFYNNIIVALPDNVTFVDGAGHRQPMEKIGGLEGNCQLVLPKEMNSICVIDGQHRIYAHYESGVDSKQEKRIADLRKQLHLLVTGLVFPSNMAEGERARMQSEIFLEINSNVKRVPQNVLLQIKRIKNPIASESIAQFVIEKLNKEGIFFKLFQVSSLDVASIKTASIVQFALRYLVTVIPADGKRSLFTYWTGDKEKLLEQDTTAIAEYVKFCADTLRTYFGAIKKNMRIYWDDETAKLLSVISINGFIIALTRQLNTNGVQDFDFYNEKFKDWNFDFSREGFPYTSSQYRKFSSRILEDVFKLPPDTE